MTTLTATTATAGLILALDLGKYKTVACAYPGDPAAARFEFLTTAEVFAKLLGLVGQHWALLLSCWGQADRSLRKAAPGIRRQALSILYALASCRQLCRVLAVVVRSLKVAARINKSKKSLRTYRILQEPSLLDGFA